MISSTIDHNSNKTARWQAALSEAITDPRELLHILNLDLNLLPAAITASTLFALKVPRSFVDRMQKGNPQDPLLLQVLPLGAEHAVVPGYTIDPLGEKKANPIPGLLHKYKSRVLLTLVGTCAINCRFCFRRHFPYMENNPGTRGWNKTLEYIANDASITEIILSGGDPLVASDKVLRSFSEKLDTIPHVKRLRIHTRLPITLPERITPEFIDWISHLKQKPILITHCNHAQEINEEVILAIEALKKAGVTLLNQTVLLKGINDDIHTLTQLSESLFDIGIQPYYLHTLDKVEGISHFDLPRETALALHWEMSKQLSGYLVPKLVCEEAGAPTKINLSSTYADS